MSAGLQSRNLTLDLGLEFFFFSFFAFFFACFYVGVNQEN